MIAGGFHVVLFPCKNTIYLIKMSNFVDNISNFNFNLRAHFGKFIVILQFEML